MNSKMTRNSHLSKTEPKTKPKTNYSRNRITEMEIAWELSVGWAEGGKGTENKKHKW